MNGLEIIKKILVHYVEKFYYKKMALKLNFIIKEKKSELRATYLYKKFLFLLFFFFFFFLFL